MFKGMFKKASHTARLFRTIVINFLAISLVLTNCVYFNLVSIYFAKELYEPIYILVPWVHS